jgi:hypothetical protein
MQLRAFLPAALCAALASTPAAQAGVRGSTYEPNLGGCIRFDNDSDQYSGFVSDFPVGGTYAEIDFLLFSFWSGTYDAGYQAEGFSFFFGTFTTFRVSLGSTFVEQWFLTRTFQTCPKGSAGVELGDALSSAVARPRGVEPTRPPAGARIAAGSACTRARVRSQRDKAGRSSPLRLRARPA